MSDGEYQVLSGKIDTVLRTLTDFKKDTKENLGGIRGHLKELNNKVASHEVSLAGKADNEMMNKLRIGVEKNKVNKIFWFAFTGIFGLCSALITFILTKGG